MTVKPALLVPVSPSVTVTSLIDSVGIASSLVIVPRPWSSLSVAFAAFRDRPEGFVGLVEASPWTGTVTVFVVSPGAKVSVPLAAA